MSRKTVEVKLTLPIQVAVDLELLLFDPVRNKIAYGARSHLITDLLKGWIAEKKIEENERIIKANVN